MNRKNLNVFTTSKISIEPGNDSKIEITEDYLLALKEMFIQNKTLIHCDFSHCGLSLYECEIMNEGLKKNHTILGIHMVGNKMNVDSLGFLKSDELIPSLWHVAPRINNVLKMGQLTEDVINLKASSNWWICEGWSEMSFKFDPYASNNPPEKELSDKDSILIHFSFDSYAPDMMEMDDVGAFNIIRMVPPIEFNYYFTINGVPKYATDLDKEQISEEVNVKLPFANVSQKVMKEKELINMSFLDKLICRPRPEKPVVEVEIIDEIPDQIDIQWDIRDSVFWGYMIDTPDLYWKWFEYDWSKCKIPKIIREEKEQK